nr:telomere length regulator protein rif1 [Quercus suber]
MLSSASIFETLPQRPPTPPRDLAAEKEEDSRTIEHAIDFLENDYDIDSAERHDQTLESKAASDFAAPEQSPSSSQDPSNSTKRVEFSPFPKFHQIARLGQISSPSHQLSKRSPLNRHAKPRRSILKQSSYVLDPPTPDELENTLSYFSPQDPSSFAKMLQSVIQHLSGQRQDARLDGYLALNGAIKAYDGVVPDVQALASKMDIIMQFLARDIVCKTPSGTLDTNMVTQSLKLVAAIMFVPTLMESWDDDFRAFLIDRSATVMESTDVAKAIVKMHMFILAHQRFRSSSVLTSARAERIITTLQTIEDRCSGNTTVASRLIIYTRLLDQAPAVMMARSRDWLEHTFHGMLSSIKEIRIRAIELCQAAGLVLGQHPHGVKPIRDMLETDMEEGKTYGEYLNDRMLQMVSDSETGVFVPQIWAAVLLFFRYKRSQVERWPRFRTWLMIIQKCLNSSDINIKYAANRAWNKMVFVMMPDESMSSTMKTMLRAPVAAGFRRRNHDRHAQEERQIAAETYYNLLHYCLRPGLNHQEIDCAWDSYVDTILPERCKASIKGRSMALQTIRGLLATTAGTWNFNAANESEPIKPEDLPKLDPRWVRSRLSKVLNVLEPAISDSMFKVPKLNIELDATLQALYTSIAEAGNQEVRSSIELKEAVAVLVNLLRKLWLEGTTVPTENILMFIKRYHSLILDAVRIIGPSSFAEDILTKMKDDDKDIVFTPSHRPSKHHAKPYPPLLSLFLGLHTTPAVFAVAGQEEILSLGSELVDLLIAPRPSPATKIELLGRLVHACSLDAQFTPGSALSALLWTCIGTCTSQILATQTVQSNSSNVNTLGHQLRGVSAVLTAGLSFTSEYPACINNILTLYDTAISLARSQAGTAGAAMAITEPCASRLNDLPTEVPVAAKLPFASHMLRSSVWPRSQHELDRAQKALWNVSLSSNKSSVFEPFVKTSQMATQFLASAYGSFDNVVPSDGVDTTLQFLESTMAFLINCPQILLATTLGTIQHGFVCWVEDRRSKTSNEILSTKVIRHLVSTVLILIQCLDLCYVGEAPGFGQ